MVAGLVRESWRSKGLRCGYLRSWCSTMTCRRRWHSCGSPRRVADTNRDNRDSVGGVLPCRRREASFLWTAACYRPGTLRPCRTGLGDESCNDNIVVGRTVTSVRGHFSRISLCGLQPGWVAKRKMQDCSADQYLHIVLSSKEKA